MILYSIYGLRVRSAIELPAPELGVDDAPPDLVVRRGPDRVVSDQAPPGKVLAEIRHGRLGYCMAQARGRATIRFFLSVDFDVSADATEAVAHVAPDALPGVASVLLTGTALSLILALRGEPVLHASAVSRAGRAVAFAGSSGVGKSTLAAVALAGGARLLTDDVLRVSTRHAPPLCFTGSNELRLRPSVPDAIRETVKVFQTAATPDGKWAVRPGAFARTPIPLRALVFPEHIDGPEQSPFIDTLSSPDVLSRLLLSPRLAGLRDARLLRQQMARFAEVARAVPGYRVALPRAPDVTGMRAILDGVGA